MEPFLSPDPFHQSESESLTNLHNACKDLGVVVEVGERCDCHDLGDSAKSEYFWSTELLHIAEALWNALKSVCDHVI